LQRRRPSNPSPCRTHADEAALDFAYCSFCKIHKSHRLTPAISACITNRLWGVADIAKLLADWDRSESMLSKPHKKSLEEVASIMGNAQPGSTAHTKMAAELARRQTAEQIKATKIMWWSLLAIAVTSGFAALFQFLSWYAPRIPN